MFWELKKNHMIEMVLFRTNNIFKLSEKQEINKYGNPL